MNINNRQFQLRTLCLQLIFALSITGCAAAPVAETANSGRRDDFLRTRVDSVRDRYWVLGIDHVSVYNVADKRLIRRVVLPGWNVAGSLCPPDMAIDRTGAALISSNIMPTLWRIDAKTFAVTRREITLKTRENWDTGFSGIAFAADGALFAVTALPVSLWRIDVNSGDAAKVELSKPVLGTCALNASYRMHPGVQNIRLALCVAGRRGPQRIDISPDFASGRVSEKPCDGLSAND